MRWRKYENILWTLIESLKLHRSLFAIKFKISESLSVPNGNKNAVKKSKMKLHAKRKKYGIFVRIRDI